MHQMQQCRYRRSVRLPDMNLLPALDALLRTASVAQAAQELEVSPSAMSRTLGRLRRVVGDPLLVPAGRGLALTAKAVEMRAQVELALAGAVAVLQPPRPLDLPSLRRTFTVRADETFAVVAGTALTARIAADAPGVRLRILPAGAGDPADLRSTVDLDVAPLPELPPDVHSRALRQRRYVAVGRAGGPHADSPLNAARFASFPQVTATRRGRAHSVVDVRLAALGLHRDVIATVPTCTAACFYVLDTDALALVPAEFAAHLAATLPIAVHEIPLDLPTQPVGMAWHLRHDTDLGHRWLRTTVADIVKRTAR